MLNFLNLLNQFILDLLFPPSCINCQSEGSYLCQDCLSLVDVSPNQYCPFCRPPKIVFDGRTCDFCKRTKNLDGLYSAAPYHDFIIKKTIAQFKYEPYIKALSKPLSLLIIKHFQLLEYPLGNPSGSNGVKEVLVPIPLAKKRLRQRGFNQSEEIAKELSVFFNIPLLCNVLVKTKETLSQVELSGSQRDKPLFHPSLRSGKEREENVKGVFFCKNSDAVRGKKIFLVDDVFTTGSTMEECARVLKIANAKEVWGIVVARE